MKKQPKILFFFGLIAFTVLTAATSFSTTTTSAPTEEGDRAQSLSAFATILTVLKSPRCMNCHPSDDYPRQGDDRHIHLFNVMRGADDKGGPVQKCATCHHEENNPYTNVPGAPHWALAPKSMGWQGLSDLELGQALLDKERNGGRSPEDLVEHMSKDALVLWAWEPGGQRVPPPVALDDFRAALEQWLENGAHIPAE